ncbi:MAG TPA: hypothetical protein DCE78_00895 [Bacteroidetes bacterium]|nr:hypothetical protein [Bacteroidota bacterium]
MFADIESKYEGNLHIHAIKLGSETSWKYRENDLVATASTIKLPILMHAAMCVYDGYLSWDTKITLKESDKVGGMGVLQHLNTPHELTLHDACYLMTAISDNTATNLVMDVVGIDNVNQFIRTFGLTDTKLFRKAFSPNTEDSKVFGLGQTSASDMLTLLSEIYRPNKLPLSVVNDIRSMLSKQTDQVSIPRVLPHGWSYEGKTGRVTEVRGDVGYVKAPDGREWLLSMFCYGLTTENWSIDNDGLLAIAEATKRILDL